jgi:hypothetical protein
MRLFGPFRLLCSFEYPQYRSFAFALSRHFEYRPLTIRSWLGGFLMTGYYVGTKRFMECGPSCYFTTVGGGSCVCFSREWRKGEDALELYDNG